MQEGNGTTKSQALKKLSQREAITAEQSYDVEGSSCNVCMYCKKESVFFIAVISILINF